MFRNENEQIAALRLTRKEFEEKVHTVLKLNPQVKNLSNEDIQEIVRTQINKVIKYGIKDEDLATLFIELSFKYPALQPEVLDYPLEGILKRDASDFHRVEGLIDHLSLREVAYQ